MRRMLVTVPTALVLAISVASGLLFGASPMPARAALVAAAVADSLTVKHDRTLTAGAPGVLRNDLNLLGGASAILVSGVSHGTLALRSDGGYTYTPAAGFVGVDSFRYRPSGLLSTAATATISVTNAAPVAKPDAYVFSGSTLVVPAPGVLANDIDADGDSLIAELDGGGISGSLDLEENGALRFTPGGGFSGSGSVSYRVWDGLAWSATTTITLTRSAASPTPVPTPKPTPVPTPKPTPAPTVRPTPTAAPTLPPSVPLPSLPLPSLTPSVPLPSAGVLPTPPPAAPADPSTTPRTSNAPSASPAAPAPAGDDGSRPDDGSPPPQPGGTGGAGGAPSGDGGQPAPAGRPSALTLRFDDTRLSLQDGPIGLLAGLEIWAVPAASIAGPGILVLVWLALQTGGAAAWIPAVRRLRGERRNRPGFVAR
jgi:hypothetical protein